MNERPRVLVAITVYNGRAFVPAAVRSATRLSREAAEIDVLVLDDASPDPGWSGDLAALCRGLGVGYYRTPRNLGIPRNVNLGLLHAMRAGYDYVLISNSDVLYPANLIDQLVRIARSDDSIGSVTAWSNNVSAYSLPNDDPDMCLADQSVLDWLSACLAGHFGDAAMDVPAGISFSILIPTPVIRDVGIMDPIFGRGYCEETDWSQRSLAAGYRVTLAVGTFVYHQGRGSNLEAGLLAAGESTVPANEAVIDLRYPLFRSQVDAFLHSGLLQKAHSDAIERVMQDAGQQFGYSIEVGWVPRVMNNDEIVRCLVSPQTTESMVRLDFIGFRHRLELDDPEPAHALRQFFKAEPREVNLLDRGEIATRLRDAFNRSGTVHELRNYPTNV